MPERHGLRRWAGLGVLVVLLLAVVTVVLQNLGEGDVFSLVDEASGDWAYLAVFLLVFADAICPVFPGETTLNAASTLAAQGVLDLGLVMLMGALGAIVGDSALYWIARLCGQRFQPRLEAASENPKVSAALQFLGSRASVLLVAGRFVPGVRFAVNATLGLSALRVSLVPAVVSDRGNRLVRVHLRARLSGRHLARRLPTRVGDHLRPHHDPGARRDLPRSPAEPEQRRPVRGGSVLAARSLTELHDPGGRALSARGGEPEDGSLPYPGCSANKESRCRNRRDRGHRSIVVHTVGHDRIGLAELHHPWWGGRPRPSPGARPGDVADDGGAAPAGRDPVWRFVPRRRMRRWRRHRRAAPGSLPTVRVVGVDFDEVKLDLARSDSAAAGFPDIEFRIEDVTEPPPSRMSGVRRRLHALRADAPDRPRGSGGAPRGPSGARRHTHRRGHRQQRSLLPSGVGGLRAIRPLVHRGRDPARRRSEHRPRLPFLLRDAGLDGVSMNVVQPSGFEGEVKFMVPITMEAIAASVVTPGWRPRRRRSRPWPSSSTSPSATTRSSACRGSSRRGGAARHERPRVANRAGSLVGGERGPRITVLTGAGSPPTPASPTSGAARGLDQEPAAEKTSDPGELPGRSPTYVERPGSSG